MLAFRVLAFRVLALRVLALRVQAFRVLAFRLLALKRSGREVRSRRFSGGAAARIRVVRGGGGAGVIGLEVAGFVEFECGAPEQRRRARLVPAVAARIVPMRVTHEPPALIDEPRGLHEIGGTSGIGDANGTGRTGVNFGGDGEQSENRAEKTEAGDADHSWLR
ncbi:hypothetical protein [Paraburkholderia sp. J41]|uniref:hypothetical protein n=1 Tax=Paraburkholderia sp. J41 TaxID=2805433 RepID=UPI002AC341C0|nr:hypothetical protein [Paraburkholderia sp. J41]